MSRLVFAHSVLVGIAALAFLAGAVPIGSPGHVHDGSAGPAPLHPRPLVSGVTLVSTAGAVGTSGNSGSVNIAAVAGDTLFAFGTGVGGTSPVISGGSLSWTLNVSTSLGGYDVEWAHANVTSNATVSVSFSETSATEILLSVWDVHGSAGRFAHIGTGTAGTVGPLSDAVQVDNASGLLGLRIWAVRPTGGSDNSFDTNLSYASDGSTSSTRAGSGLWMAPPNGTGLIPVEASDNSSSSGAVLGFSIDPASAPPVLTAGIASFGPDPSEIGLATVVFNGTAAGGSAPYAFNWSFGDGSFVNDTGNSTGLDSTPHVYATAGVFPVILTVWDSLGANSTAFANATVDAALALAITANVTSPCVVPTVNDTCLVDLNTSAAFGLGNLDIEFLLLNETGVVVDSSFGNSSTSSFFNATFPENLSVGTYDAWLNGTDDAGANVSFHLVFVVSIPAPGGGGLISGGTFDLILIGAVLAVIAVACVGMAGSSRRRRGPR